MLKKRITRIIAGILSCLFVGIFVSKVTGLIVGCRNNINEELTVKTISDEINDIYYKLWAIGNMYLRNLDSKGNFKGTEELEEQTITELKKLGCIDDKGNLSIKNISDDYEYLVSYGDNSFSNTDKSYDELSGEYSLSRKNDNIIHPYYSSWLYMNSDFNVYSTNYGMYYYYLNGRGIALFDYDTTGLDSYVDELGATIYYKTDGTTPVPDDYYNEEYEEFLTEYNDGIKNKNIKREIIIYNNNDVVISTETIVYDEYGNIIEHSRISENVDGEGVSRETIVYDENGEIISHEKAPIYEDGLYIYNSEKGEFVKIEQDKFTETQLTEMPLTIAIKPSDEIITDFENYYNKIESQNKNAVRSAMSYIPLIIIAFVLMLFVLIMGGYSEKDKKYVMSFWEKIFTEIPITVIIFAVAGGVTLIDADYYGIYQFITDLYNEKTFIVIYGIAYFALFGIVLLMLNTLITRIKCRSFWKTTLIWAIIITVFGWIKKFINLIAEKKVKRDMLKNDLFTKRFIIRTVAFALAESFFMLVFIDWDAYGMLFFASVILFIAYMVLSLMDLMAMNRISKHISEINSGDYTPHIEPATSSAYCMTEKLNNISAGIQKAVDRQVQSERMKIDLVTNVSHDLKTPLTSIISYIDLLSTEELSPEARDYVTIIDNKSQRLKSMVADLFDLAKATSHTDIDMERIDIVILANQVLADLNDKIETSEKIIRTDIQVETAPVMAEGKKMYRVFQNLIDNALKYSLNGTRIYLTLKNELGYCVVNIKNISSYEMNFTPDEIIERFARGDESRSTEGNGLGLSIAKSFTEACGGTFRITIDGDVFTAEIKLPIIK